MVRIKKSELFLSLHDFFDDVANSIQASDSSQRRCRCVSTRHHAPCIHCRLCSTNWNLAFDKNCM